MAEWMVVSLVITALILMVEHWFPVPIKLHVIANYILGVLALLAGQSLWLYKSERISAILDIWIFAIIGGITVSVCYAIDWVLKTWVRAKTNDNVPDPPKD